MIRTFLAFPIHFNSYLSLTFDILKKILSNEKIKFVDPNNLHITIHFFGNLTKHEIDNLIKVFEPLKFNKIKTFVESYFVFNIEKYPSVVGIKLFLSPELELLVNKFHQTIKKLNYELDNRKFVPHVTYGRVKNYFNISSYKKLLAYELNKEEIILNKVCLYKSTLTPHGPIYEKLWTKELL